MNTKEVFKQEDSVMGVKLTVMTLDIDPDSKPITKVFNKDELTLGRLPSNDVVLNRPEISGIHARLRVEKGQNGEPSRLFITDLGSSNGTSVEKNQLRARIEVGMMPNERIFIGNYVIKPSVTSVDVEMSEDLSDDYTMTAGSSQKSTQGEERLRTQEFKPNSVLGEAMKEYKDITEPEKEAKEEFRSVANAPMSDISGAESRRSLFGNPESLSSEVKSPINFESPVKSFTPSFSESSSKDTSSENENKTKEFSSPFGHPRPEKEADNFKSSFSYSSDILSSDSNVLESDEEMKREEEEARRAREEIAASEYRLSSLSHAPKDLAEPAPAQVTPTPAPESYAPEKFEKSYGYQSSPPSSLATVSADGASLSIKIKVDGSDVRSMNFIASAFTEVKGFIQHRGKPLSGVVVDAGSLGTAISQSDGGFVLPKALEGTDYTLNFSKDKFIFEPSTIQGKVTFNGAPPITQATQLFTISGVITHQGIPLGGVEVDGGILGKVITKGDGSYTFDNVPEGKEYDLRLYKEGYVFKN